MNTRDNHATSGAHASAPPGTLIANRYEVVKQAGTGNFARVFECVDRRTGLPVAVKLLKRGYERDADFECDILKAINKHDVTEAQNCVKLIEKTTWNGIATIVFNLKGAPLRNSSFPFESRAVARLAADIGNALDFLHFSVRAVHTDLKPENILAELPDSKYEAKWSICDLGSASFYTSRLDTDLITTRPYRAPEVVLNKGWSYPADTWSLGCILYEVRTGRKLFDCHTDADHLAMMEQRLGAIPGHYSRSRPTTRFKLLKDELAHEDPEYLDLLFSLLHYDPARRIKCRDVATHPYVTKRLIKREAAPIRREAAPISRSSSTVSVASAVSSRSSSAADPLSRDMARMEITKEQPRPVPMPQVRTFGREIKVPNYETKPMTTNSKYGLQKPLISPAVAAGKPSGLTPRLMGGYKY
jgi:serine/threonine protein kinase